jgi:ferrous iron transport protein B
MPLIVVLNMCDMAEARGLSIDKKHLAYMLGGVPVISMVAGRGQGLDELKRAIEGAVVPQDAETVYIPQWRRARERACH